MLMGAPPAIYPALHSIIDGASLALLIERDYGLRAYELGVFFWSLSLDGHGDDVWQPFLRGYRSCRQQAPRRLP